jgi:hypothetical protein
MVDALNRGVSLTIVTSSVAATDEVACDRFMEQPFTAGINPALLRNSTKFHHLKVGYFFHDKIYISDQEGYIGGQNLSGSSSIDFGVTILRGSPLYGDLKQRAGYFVGGANGAAPAMNFKYTATNPYVDPTSKAEYFLGLSPFSPTCGTKGGAGVRASMSPVFPQAGMSLSGMYKSVGPYDNAGSVSYEWMHLHDLIKNARKFIRITNFDFSFFGSSLSQAGYDVDIANAINAAVSNHVKVEMWIHNAPMADSMPMDPSSTCGMVTCQHTSDLLKTWTATGYFAINYWYSQPYSEGFPPCKILHAKIYYSDYGLLVSSSNFVPDYWCRTPDTALCVKYSGGAVPDWISQGVENCFSILESNKTVSSSGKNYACGHESTPNIDQDGAPCGVINGVYVCASTCASCSKTTKAGVKTNVQSSACNGCLKNE